MAWRGFFDDRFASAWLALAMALAAAAILWLSRGTTFWIDELVLFMDAPRLDLERAFDPHVGHLVLTVRVVYKGLFELFGASYLPFRLLGVATLLLTVGLLFTYLRRRVPPFVALAPCLVLLLFGSDSLHVLTGNAFGVLLAVSCGLGALLALEREDPRGDISASALLCLGVLTYTVALAFLAGAAIQVLLRRDRWRGAWIVLIPLILYGAWFVWATTSASGPNDETTLSNILLLPAWAVQALGAVLGALSGFDYAFPGSSSGVGIGPSLAVLALVGVAFRVGRGSIPVSIWGALATLVALWGLGVLADGGNRTPEAPRYLFTGAVAVLMVAAGLLAGLRWSRPSLLGLYVVAACGVAVNLSLLRDEATMLRSAYAVQVEAAFAAVDIAGDRARRDFDPPAVPGGRGFIEGGQSPLGFPFGLTSTFGHRPVAAYREAAERYGSLGYSPADVRAAADMVRTQTDSILAAALDLRLRPALVPPHPDRCHLLRSGSARQTFAKLPIDGALLLSPERASVSVRRFARKQWVFLGALSPRTPALLDIPPDSAPDPWWLASSAGSLRVCALR